MHTAGTELTDKRPPHPAWLPKKPSDFLSRRIILEMVVASIACPTATITRSLRKRDGIRYLISRLSNFLSMKDTSAAITSMLAAMQTDICQEHRQLFSNGSLDSTTRPSIPAATVRLNVCGITIIKWAVELQKWQRVWKNFWSPGCLTAKSKSATSILYCFLNWGVNGPEVWKGTEMVYSFSLWRNQLELHLRHQHVIKSQVNTVRTVNWHRSVEL